MITMAADCSITLVILAITMAWKGDHDAAESAATIAWRMHLKKKKAAGADANDPMFGITRANLRNDVQTLIATIDNAKTLLAELEEW